MFSEVGSLDSGGDEVLADAALDGGHDLDAPDAPPPDGNDEELAVLYGPQPVDVVDEGQPADVVQTDCPPMVAYGPPPCDSDEDCVQWFGEGWVCDKDNSFPDGCGGTTTWPACVEKK